jgi:hypothetical protein
MKKMTTYMQPCSCDKRNVYCHLNHKLKQESAAASSSETFHTTDYLHGYGSLENGTATEPGGHTNSIRKRENEIRQPMNP